MMELHKRDALAARALEVTILTACRTSEVLQAEWPEIVYDVWIIPAARMKQRREHRVPLSAQAQAILAGLPRRVHDQLIFPGHRDGRPLSGMSMEMLFAGWAPRRLLYTAFVARSAIGQPRKPIFRVKSLSYVLLMISEAKSSVPIADQTCCLNAKSLCRDGQATHCRRKTLQ